MKKKNELHHVLDEHLRLKRWPSRRPLRQLALTYLASKFTTEFRYTEAAVNALLRRWSAFDDPALLRRELFDWGFLGRTPDCREYWKVIGVIGDTRRNP